MPDTPDQYRQPQIEGNEFLQESLPDTDVLAAVLQNALPPALWSDTATVRLRQIQQGIPTQPALRRICLHCELLNAAGQQIEASESWFLTAKDWDQTFVVAKATQQPQVG